MENLPIRIKLDESFFLEEERCDYVVKPEMKQLWAVLLDLMVQFDKVCKKNGVKYFLDSGTLLGAVRHKGFIPWDNDVDVIMFRSEYDKLCKVAPTEFSAPYFWQTNETDPGSLRRHAQLRNSLTTCLRCNEMENGVPEYGYNQGAFLDVFILDEIPDNDDECALFCSRLTQCLSLLGNLKDNYWSSGRNVLFKELQHQAFVEFESLVSRYNGSGQTRVANISLLPDVEHFFSVEWFSEVEEASFEGFKFPIPKDYDMVLAMYYGNWRKLVRSDNTHGDIVFDMTKPYTEFLSEAKPSYDEKIASYPVLAHYKSFTNAVYRKDKKIRHLRRKIKILGISLGAVALALISLIITISL